MFEYQDRDWVTDITYESESDVTLFDVDYIHDDVGNIDSLSYINVSEPDNVGYDYDNLNRLSKATSSTHSDYEYAYDDNGNIDWRKIDGDSTDYDYETGKPNRLTDVGSNVLDYDANGNIDSYNGGNELLHYDHRNQLDWYEGSQDEYYDYDAEGLRVYKEGEGISYGENFNDNDVDDGDPTDWYKTGSYWSASGGELKWTSSGYASGQCSNPDLSYDDFTAEFDVMADGYYTTSYWAAFAFRKTSHSDWYSTSGYMVYYRYNGSIVLYEAGYGDLASSSTGKDLSTWRRVKIEASGSSIKVYVDGTLEINKTDATYTNGYFGLNVFGVKARYDNLTMYDDTKVYYVRDVNGDVLAEYDFAGNLLAEYVYANGQRIAKMTPGGSEDVYLNDHLGSARAMTESGWSANYYPFGEVASQTGSGFDTRFDFTGQERDQGTGLMYFGARYYDPEIGRWLSVDPLSHNSSSLTPYHYVRNNPLAFFDPDGLAEFIFHIRSFIASKSTGLGLFRGDGRGFNTNPTSRNNTSRISQQFTLDTETGALSNFSARSSFTRFNPAGTERTAVPTRFADANGSNGSSLIKTDVSAKDPLTPQFVTPALNISTGLSVKEAGQKLSVIGTISGDSFPSTEAFVADAAGNKVFLGAFAANGGLGGISGVAALIGDNQNTLITINVTINLDKSGNFVSVSQGDRTFSLEEFNELFSSLSSGQQ